MAVLNAFSAIGRFFVLLTLVCGALAAAIRGEAGAALAITAFTTGIIGVVFVFVGSRLGTVTALNKALREVGVAGTAVVVSIRSTGVRVNGALVQEMELDVDNPVHAPYRTTIRQRVPLFWGPVAPGTRVGVVVDSTDRYHLAVDWDAEVAQRGPSAPEPTSPVAPSGTRYDMDRLLRVGRSAKATIVSVEEIVGMVELGIIEIGPPGPESRLFLVDMEVQQAGMDPYEVRVAHPIPDRLVGRVGARTKLRVAVDREDDLVVAIDWESVHR